MLGSFVIVRIFDQSKFQGAATISPYYRIKSIQYGIPSIQVAISGYTEISWIGVYGTPWIG